MYKYVQQARDVFHHCDYSAFLVKAGVYMLENTFPPQVGGHQLISFGEKHENGIKKGRKFERKRREKEKYS
jgi:hypothetical protein